MKPYLVGYCSHGVSYLQALTSIYATEGSLAKAREKVEVL